MKVDSNATLASALSPELLGSEGEQSPPLGHGAQPPAQDHGALRLIIQPRGTGLDPGRPVTPPPLAAPPGLSARG